MVYSFAIQRDPHNATKIWPIQRSSSDQKQELRYSFATITLQRSALTKEHNLFYPFAMQRRPRNKIYYILWQRTALQTRRRESLDSYYHYTVFPLLFSTSTQNNKGRIPLEFPMHPPVLADATHLLIFSFYPRGGSLAQNSSWKRMEEGYSKEAFLTSNG